MTGRKSYRVPYLLAILTSICYAIWAILSLIIVNGNGVSFVVSLYSVYLAFFTIAWLLVFLYERGHVHFTSRMIKSAIIQGTCYTLGTISLFYALSYATAFPLTEAVSFSNIIVFAFLIRKVNESDVGLRYFISTILVFLGIAAIVFGVYGAGFVFNTTYLLSLLALVVFYSLAAYYTFKPMTEDQDPIAFQAVGMTTQVAITSVVVFGSGLSGQLSNIAENAWIYALIIAAALVIGFLSELHAFKIAKRAKAGVINTISILTSLEIIPVALYSILFLSLNLFDITTGTVLFMVGIVFLER